MNSSQDEKNLLKVAKLSIDEAEETRSRLSGYKEGLGNHIEESRQLLESLGIDYNACVTDYVKPIRPARTIIFRSFEELLAEANEKYPDEISFRDIFTNEEIGANINYIEQLNEEFNAIHRLDEIDIIIPAVAGILGGAVDCVFGGFVKTLEGKSVPGPLSDWIQKQFDKVLTPERIKELEKKAKVTFDAQDNRNTTVYVNGLSSYFHRFVSLGHDPILGFIFGVFDMLRGTMTTLDTKGKFVIQVMENYSDRKAQVIFEAFTKVFLHMLSDVNTPAGLPVPFMALFNKLRFGKIGENDTIAELVKSMYGQGYDFRHFCSMSIPVMIIEVIVRVSYFVKRLNEGHSFKDSIPVGLNHEKKPKLGTMLFIAHSASTAINAGKVAFTENPLNINYVQWLAFARYSIKQIKWVFIDKPYLRRKYVADVINGQWGLISDNLDDFWNEFTKDAIIVNTPQASGKS